MNANDNRLWILISDIRTAYDKTFQTPHERMFGVGAEATECLATAIGELTRLATLVSCNQYDECC
jgi:hypothetical protein